MPHKYIVNKAFESEKKAYPVRWLIVMVSTVGAFILGLLTLIFIDNYKFLFVGK